MNEFKDEFEFEDALRDGLGALPVPELSSEFDARVLAALRAPCPWWQCLWEPARPLLLGASCSLAVTLCALHWTLSAPIAAPLPASAPVSLSAAPRPVPPMDALLDRPDLSAGSLSVWAARPSEPPSQDRRPEPHRHAQVGRRECLVV